MSEPLLTVFTPTYNRRDLIHKCYESLCQQTNKNFCWLIIDDGSNDDTESLIRTWQKENNEFTIRYDYKENGGLHTAYNRGIELADTELFMCIDSDDWLPDDAVERIETLWHRVKSKGYVGIMGIDRYENGNCVGDAFPNDVYEMYLHEKLVKYRLDGDKKMIHRTDLLKKVAPMPSYEDELFFNPSYMMYELDQFGKLYVTNDCFCIVNYQPDGMSSNMYKQYRNSPQSYAQTRKLYLSFPNTPWQFKLRHSIHYVSSGILAKRFWVTFKESPYMFWAIIGLFPGWLLATWITYKTR